MTQEQFEAREAELLARVPPEFRSAISSMAYERGHLKGWYSILWNIEDIMCQFHKPIEAYTARITKK